MNANLTAQQDLISTLCAALMELGSHTQPVREISETHEMGVMVVLDL